MNRQSEESFEYGLAIACDLNGCAPPCENDGEVLQRPESSMGTTVVNRHAVRPVSRTVVRSLWRELEG